MTELEKIAYTKEFIDKLANGINPLDDTPIPDGDIMNNVRLSRCMFYVSDILRQVIENGGTTVLTSTPTKPFSITLEQLSRYEFSPFPLSVSEISKKIYALAGDNSMKKISNILIGSWLVHMGMLYEHTENGKRRKLPTEEGRRLGISTRIRSGMDGEYEAVLYDNNAQRFILDNFATIIAYGKEVTK